MENDKKINVLKDWETYKAENSFEEFLKKESRRTSITLIAALTIIGFFVLFF